jgi:hypothetical protein
MRNSYGRTGKSGRTLYISEKVLTGTKGVCCGGNRNGEDFIMRDRIVTGKGRVLMSREEARRLV